MIAKIMIIPPAAFHGDDRWQQRNLEGKKHYKSPSACTSARLREVLVNFPKLSLLLPCPCISLIQHSALKSIRTSLVLKDLRVLTHRGERWRRSGDAERRRKSVFLFHFEGIQAGRGDADGLAQSQGVHYNYHAASRSKAPIHSMGFVLHVFIFYLLQAGQARDINLPLLMSDEKISFVITRVA